MVDTIGWRFAFLINVPLLAFAVWATLRHVDESRDTETTGRFDWLGAFVAALAVGGLAFGVIRGQANAWADPGALDRDRGRRRLPGRLPAPDGPPAEPARAARAVPRRARSRRSTWPRSSSTAALYVTFFYQAVILQGVLGYTALGGRASSGMPGGIMLALLSTRIGTLAGRIGARRFLVAGPLLMALGLLWYARLPVDSATAGGRRSTIRGA